MVENTRTSFVQRLHVACDIAGIPSEKNGRNKALGKLLGVSPESARKWLNGMTMPTEKKRNAFAKKLKVSRAWLFEGVGSPDKSDVDGSRIEEPCGSQYLVETGSIRSNYRTVPVIGMAKLGDDGYFEEQQYPVGHGDGYIDTPTTDPNAYALKVVGDSMFPAIRHGWYVVIEPNLETYNGMIALFKLVDGRKMIKEMMTSNDGFYTLLSINPDHSRITLSQDDIEDIHPVAFIVPPNKVGHP